jgi:Hydrophobic surface binding protein A
MQFRNIFAFALFGAALASPAIQSTQDLPTIKAALKSVEVVLIPFHDAVVALKPGADAAKASADLVAKSNAVEAAIKAATAKISATDALTLAEAIQVQTASQSLTKLTQQTVDDLIAKKDIIKAANQLQTTQKQLASQKIAADAMAKAITSKLPSAVQAVAATLGKAVGDSLDKGAKAFSS